MVGPGTADGGRAVTFGVALLVLVRISVVAANVVVGRYGGGGVHEAVRDASSGRCGQRDGGGGGARATVGRADLATRRHCRPAPTLWLRKTHRTMSDLFVSPIKEGTRMREGRNG